MLLLAWNMLYDDVLKLNIMTHPIDSKGMAFDEKIPSIFNFYWIVCKGAVLAVLAVLCL